MHKLGFKHLLFNSGLFIMKNKRGEPKVIVIIYVDDAVFMGPNKSIVSKARDCFMKVWECHVLSPQWGVWVHIPKGKVPGQSRPEHAMTQIAS